MANRRMFSKTVIDSDLFLDLPLSSQSLYFHLAMRADDEGFLNNAKNIRKMLGASEDDLKLLIAKGFLIWFDSGVCVIRHWDVHNYIRGDRKKTPRFPRNGTSFPCQKMVSMCSNPSARRQKTTVTRKKMSVNCLTLS